MKIYRIAQTLPNFPNVRNRQRSIEDVSDMIYEERHNILTEFFSPGRAKKSMMSWTVIPIGRVQKIWKDYARYHVVRDENGLEEIIEKFMRNLARVQAATDLAGHSQTGMGVEEEDGFPLLDDDNKFEFYHLFLETQYGSPISDFGLGPLWELAEILCRERTPEERLITLDQMLSVTHQRGDLSALFIEGGRASLDELSS